MTQITNIDIYEAALAVVEEDLADHIYRAKHDLPLKFCGISLEAEIQILRERIRMEYDRLYNTLPR